jgi:hypothetical protein
VGVVTILTHHISDMARATKNPKNPLEYNIILGIKWKKMHTNWTLQ